MKDRLEVHLRERDKLAHDIPTWEDLPFGGGDDYVKLDANAAHAIAGVLIEKGWRKPRVVTTTAELDELPVGSVVLGDKPWIKTGPDHYEDGGIGFESAASLSISRRSQGVTVLHEGEL